MIQAAKVAFLLNQFEIKAMNRIWLIVLLGIVCAGLLDNYLTHKAADRVTTIRQSCVTSPGCKTM